MKHKILMGLTLFHVLSSSASPWTNKNEFYNNTGLYTLEQKALGPTCLALTPSATERPCSPSLASQNRGSNLEALISLGGNYSKALSFVDYLNKNEKVKLVREILDEREPIEFDGHISAGFTAQNFNVWATPLRAYYFSTVRNSVSPEAYLVAMQESTASVQYGSAISESVSLGAQLTGFTRKFISNRDQVYNVLAESSDFLKSKTQNGVFFDPAITYFDKDLWDFRLTAIVENLGFVDRSFEEIPVQSQMTLAAGFQIPLDPDFGELSLLTSYRTYFESVRPPSPIHFGVNYKLGLFSGYLSGGAEEFSIGADVGFDPLKVSLLYQRLERDYLRDNVITQVSYAF